MFCNLLNFINLFQMKSAIWLGLGTRLLVLVAQIKVKYLRYSTHLNPQVSLPHTTIAHQNLEFAHGPQSIGIRILQRVHSLSE